MNNNMGKIIAECRNKNNWTQEDLANELCVSNKTISKWECGIGYPDLEIIPKIASLFNITTDLLFYGKVIKNDLVFQEKNVSDFTGLPKFTSHMYEAQSHLWKLLQALDRVRQSMNYRNEQNFRKLNKKIQEEFLNCFAIDWETISEIWWEAQEIKLRLSFLEIFSCTVMLRIKDAANFLGVSESTIRRMAKNGKIASKEINGKLFVLKSDVENLSYQYWKDEPDEQSKEIRDSYLFYLNK